MIFNNIEKDLRQTLTGKDLLTALKALNMLKRGADQERRIRLKLKAKNN